MPRRCFVFAEGLLLTMTAGLAVAQPAAPTDTESPPQRSSLRSEQPDNIGKPKVLLVIGDGAEVLDTMAPYFRLGEDYQVVVAGPKKRTYHLVMHEIGPGWDITEERPGYHLDADIAFKDVRPDDYIALVLPGGRAPEYLRYDADLMRITRSFFAKDKPVASICHGAEIIAAADVIRGKRVTTIPKCRFDVEVCGGIYVEEGVVRSGNLICAQGKKDISPWMRQFVKMIESRPTSSTSKPPAATKEQIASLDRNALRTVPTKHVVVYREPGRFAGWPANRGIWCWGNEILVAFSVGGYKESLTEHSIDKGKPAESLVARSLDGGETWTVERPAGFVGDGRKATPCPGRINFAHPDFAMQVERSEFRVSCDRGRTWQGPYALPLVGVELTSRTDYLPGDSGECLFFLSAREQKGSTDRAFCARSPDGGRTIRFLSWMTTDSSRSVMPATVRCSKNHLVSAMRRRSEQRQDGADTDRNWIDVYESADNGQTWTFLSKVANTDGGGANGNPPSMIRLNDGRLCVAYGYRAFPFGIRARLSTNQGKTWGDEIHLRDDGRMWDLGYTRMVQRPDGKVVTIYYYTTHENPEQHIAATIWSPPAAPSLR